MAERKADTRNKIMLGGLVVKAGLAEEDSAVMLGGLVVKAGLAEEDSAVILGILVQAAEALTGPDGELARRRFRRAGDQAFSDSGAGSYSRNSAAAR
jgi:Conjugal transfer protein TraD